MVQKTLSIAIKECVFWNLAEKQNMPPGNSKTISFQRYERLNPPRTALTAGQTPAGTPLVVTNVTAVCEQWGAFVPLSDEAELIVANKPFEQALELIGKQSAETIDRECQRVLRGATNIFYANARASRAALTSTDVVDTPLMRKIRAQLKNNGAPFFEGKRFVAVVDPFVSMDVQADPTFVEAAKFQNYVALTSAEIGQWMGFRFQESNDIPVIARDTNMTIAYSGGGIEAGAAPGSTTNLSDGVYAVAIVGYDSQGFETHLMTTTYNTITTSSQVAKITLPTLPSGVVAYSLYSSVAGGGTGAMKLQADNLGAGVVYIVGSGGDGVSSFNLTSGGRAAPAQPAVGVNVHQSFVFGGEFYKVASLDNLKVMVTPKGPQKGDELDQRRACGWKVFFKALITNNNFGAYVESESAYD
jgi:N4-gp56 family major capsid protein